MHDAGLAVEANEARTGVAGQVKKHAVARAAPAHVDDCVDVVASQMVAKVVRQVLIE